MRNRTALLLALLMTVSGLAVTPAAGQAATSDAPTTHVADDNLNDVMVNENGQNTAAPAGRYAPSDLKGLDVIETKETFTFVISVQSLVPQGAEAPLLESGQYHIHFRNLDRDFRLIVHRQYAAGANYFAQLQAFDPGRNAYFTITADAADLEVKEDLVAHAISATILHRDLLADGFGAAPHPEVPLTGFHISSRAMGFNFNTGRGPAGSGQKVPTPYAWDNMPDSGNSTLNGGALPVHFGVMQSGNARLKAVIPSRASNGEATTFVFQVEASNLGKAEDRFNLVAVGVPSDWSVKLPAAQITIPGNGTLLFPILVTTPFAHLHGVFKSFVVEMQSISDSSSVGRLQLGVRYVQPPQPAGHHAQLWIHSDGGSTDPTAAALQATFPGQTGVDPAAFMNALDGDTNDKNLPVPAQLDCEVTPAFDSCGGGAPGPATTPSVHYEWEIPLSPSLDMGLDFDTKGFGEVGKPSAIDVKIQSALPMNGAVFGGRLEYIEPSGESDPFGFGPQGNATVVAVLAQTTPVDIAAQSGPHAFTTLITATPGGEYIAFQKGASLVLVLTLNFTRADAFFGPRDAPVLLPEGTFTLPLVEYHDPVTDIFLSTVELVATSKADRFVNPGKSVLFNITLVNKGEREDRFLIEMTGTHAENSASPWAHMVISNPEVTLAAGGSTRFAVVVKAPEEVILPDAADLVLTATSQTDFNQRSLLHLYAVVDTRNVYPDDAAAIEQLDFGGDGEASTPGFELVALVAALAACAFLLRRRKA